MLSWLVSVVHNISSCGGQFGVPGNGTLAEYMTIARKLKAEWRTTEVPAVLEAALMCSNSNNDTASTSSGKSTNSSHISRLNVLQELAFTFAHLEHHSVAADTFSRVIELEVNTSKGHFLSSKAKQLSLANRHDEAIASFAEAVELVDSAGMTQLQYHAGAAFWKANRHSSNVQTSRAGLYINQAFEHFRASSRGITGALMPQFAMARAITLMKKYSDALKIYKNIRLVKDW